jgi:hypothetical protein
MSANAARVINNPADKLAKRVKGREHRFIPGSPCEPSAQTKAQNCRVSAGKLPQRLFLAVAIEQQRGEIAARKGACVARAAGKVADIRGARPDWKTEKISTQRP